jgi:acyl-CoA synthetase (AMP-forming)/AMP-acid ligase II
LSGSVFEMFAGTAKDAADHPFLIVPARADRDWHPNGVAYSYGDALREVERLRDLYVAAGYGHGHRVSILLENRPEFFFHYLALNAVGACIVPINPDYRHDEVAYLLDHSDAELAVVLPHRVADVAKAAAERAKPLPVVDAHAMPAELPRAPGQAPRSGASGLESECSLLYTSGTTGRPKGCLLSNLYTLNAGETYRNHGGLMEIRHGQERFYNPLPLFHINHLNIMSTAAMQTANTLVLPERFSPSRWWHEVSTHDVTIIHYLGIVAPMLLNQPPSPADRQHKVRFGIGAGIEPQLHAVFEKRFGFPMIEVWGMTETGRITGDSHEPRMIGTRAFGRPFPGLEARVVDDRDQDVPVGSDGEFLVRHSAEKPRYGFFSGYLKNEQATEDAWRGGWFHTGDVVRQDASGMLYFVDRKKHIIRRAGENIAAAEIEAVLQAHDAVAQVAVVAAPDELREEEVLACVVPMPGSKPDAALADALFEQCNARLAYFKVPGWVLFLDKLPTTGTQKVQKTQIFKPGEDPRQRPGIIDLRARKRRG